MHEVRFRLTRMSVAPFPIKELACKTHIVPMYGVSAASLFYLHHLRSCAANAMGAKGAPLNANAPVWSSHLLKFFTPRRDPTSPYRRKRLLAFWVARFVFFSNCETELAFPDFEVGFGLFGVDLEVGAVALESILGVLG